MKKVYTILLCCTAVLLALTSCEKKTAPTITNEQAVETSPAVVEVTATASAYEIDECGICYGTSSADLTKDKAQNVYDCMANPQSFDGSNLKATFNLSVCTTYYFAVYAANEKGITYSKPFSIKTSYKEPGKDDNVFPGY